MFIIRQPVAPPVDVSCIYYVYWFIELYMSIKLPLTVVDVVFDGCVVPSAEILSVVFDVSRRTPDHTGRRCRSMVFDLDLGRGAHGTGASQCRRGCGCMVSCTYTVR